MCVFVYAHVCVFSCECIITLSITVSWLCAVEFSKWGWDKFCLHFYVLFEKLFYEQQFRYGLCSIVYFFLLPLALWLSHLIIKFRLFNQICRLHQGNVITVTKTVYTPELYFMGVCKSHKLTAITRSKITDRRKRNNSISYKNLWFLFTCIL